MVQPCPVWLNQPARLRPASREASRRAWDRRLPTRLSLLAVFEGEETEWQVPKGSPSTCGPRLLVSLFLCFGFGVGPLLEVLRAYYWHCSRFFSFLVKSRVARAELMLVTEVCCFDGHTKVDMGVGVRGELWEAKGATQLDPGGARQPYGMRAGPRTEWTAADSVWEDASYCRVSAGGGVVPGSHCGFWTPTPPPRLGPAISF